MKTRTRAFYHRYIVPAMVTMAIMAWSAIWIGTTKVTAKADSKVVIKGKVSGFLPAPCNCTATVTLSITAKGNSSHLVASGVGHATTGAINSFELAGARVNSEVVLNGTVVKSTAAYLIGSAVQIKANADTKAMTFTLWPAGGPFKGQTLVFNGSGKIKVSG